MDERLSVFASTQAAVPSGSVTEVISKSPLERLVSIEMMSVSGSTRTSMAQAALALPTRTLVVQVEVWPSFVAWALPAYLAREGIEVTGIESGRPRLDGLSVALPSGTTRRTVWLPACSVPSSGASASAASWT